jgi:hypothetical protein
MGEIADMMLDGVLCETCGEYIGDEVGFPRRCASCVAKLKKPKMPTKPKWLRKGKP